MQQGNHWELRTFRINPTRNSGLGFGGRASYSRVSCVKLKKIKRVITCKRCLICANIRRIRLCAVFLMPEDYIIFFWLSFCSKNTIHFLWLRSSFVFPRSTKKTHSTNLTDKRFLSFMGKQCCFSKSYVMY